MERINFIAYCSTGDVFIPIMYIIDFIEKYIQKYGKIDFYVCTEKRHHSDLKYYDKWFKYSDIIPYNGKNSYIENGIYYVYYWCRHIDNLKPPYTSPTDLYGFLFFFKKIYDKFELTMESDLNYYKPSLLFLPRINDMIECHTKKYQNYIQKNNCCINNKTPIFFLNCNALSTRFTRKNDYNVDIILNKLSNYLKNSDKYYIISSHKYDFNYNDNIFFLKDILEKKQENMEILDFQIQSYFSNIIIGVETGVLILCQFRENINKKFLMIGANTCMYPDINLKQISTDYNEAFNQIINQL